MSRRRGEGGALRRDPQFGVGKRMPGATYVHASAEDRLPRRRLAAAKARLPADFRYQVIKFARPDGAISFFACGDFDADDEPAQGAGWLIRRDGSIRFHRAVANPWIYHHKWLMVEPDYGGFDVAQAERRSARILVALQDLAHVDPRVRSKIGRRNFWESVVLPRLHASAQAVLRGRIATEDRLST